MGIFDFLKSNVSAITKIDEVLYSDINKETFLSKYFIPRIPLIIKNGAHDWPLIKLWTKEYISKNNGDYVCTVISDSRPAHSKIKTTLANYFNSHKGKSTLTLDFDPHKSPFFLKGLKFPNKYFSKKSIHRFFFYHSVKDAGTLPHVHRDAFNILREGEKRWVMFDADRTISSKGYAMMMKTYKSYPPGTHAKDWFKKDYSKLSSKVDEVYECIQSPKDIVFIPVNYCHTVVNTSDEVLGLVVEVIR
ncbi:hypothetical protein [Patiriisocius sp. Uisw_047]|jgi:ribosomal protein L16 Arg81 hydroxylase|uniref:hypothetical protein n=1 Tax=Patiriisocius sp. Uisw_047 TaxID=3230969 RepID=UPI0039E76626